jgi:hypothetical protein
MKIEIGKSYTVSNANKKCVVEVEEFYNKTTDAWVYVETTYRSGEFAVIPQDEGEVANLLECLELCDPFELSMFEEAEMEGMFDGVCLEFDVRDEALGEQLEEADDWFDLLEELGYESEGCESTIYDGIEIVEGSTTYEV